MTKTIAPHQAYIFYIQSDAWRDRRRRYLASVDYTCEQCYIEAGHGMPIDVHHKSYANLGHEPDVDLIALCRTCHGKLHGKMTPKLGDVELECNQ